MWRDPTIRKLALARFASSSGGEASFFVGIWGRAAFEFGASAAELALLMAVFGITGIVGSAVAGPLVDRFGVKRVFVTGELLTAPAVLSLVLPTSMTQLIIGCGVVGLVGTLVGTSTSTFPPFLTADGSRLAAINGALEFAGAAALIAGPAVGALIATVGDLRWIFVLDGITSVLSAVIVARLAVRRAAVTSPGVEAAELVGGPVETGTGRLGVLGRVSTVTGELRAGFTFVYRRTSPRYVLAVAMLIWLTFGVFGNLEPLFYREVLGTGPEALGWVNAIFGIGLSAGALAVQRIPDERVTLRLGAMVAVANGLGVIAYTAWADVRVVAVGGAMWGVVLGTHNPILRTLIQRTAPEHLMGRVMGAMTVHNRLGELLPLAFAPLAAVQWGVQAALVGCGVICGGAASLLLPLGGRLDAEAPFTSGGGAPDAGGAGGGGTEVEATG
jgi:MFS transporter, DHA3 family, macrolide efflux protein